jgi:Tol biopolymer transport system component
MRPLTPALVVASALLLAPAAAHANLTYEKYPSPTKLPQVWASADDGSSAHKLAGSADNPSISPSGTRVAYAAYGSTGQPTLKTVGFAGGSPISILKNLSYAGGTAASWAPNGVTLAAVTGPEIGKQTLSLVNVPGNGTPASATKLATGYFTGVSWSPTGDRLVYGRASSLGNGTRGDLSVYTLATATTTKITHDGRSLAPVWGPTVIAFSRARKPKKKEDYDKLNIDTIKPDGTGRRHVTKLTIPFLLSGLTPTAWSGDGTRLLAEYGGQDYSQAYTVNPATGKTKKVGGKAGFVGADLSTDGKTILGATGSGDPADRHNVATVPYTGGTPKVLVKNALAPSWDR